jgi:hypothetical protein
MALSALARRLLSRQAPASPGVGVCVAGVECHRAQRVVLLAASARFLRGVARRLARGIPVQPQGAPLHHARQAREGRGRIDRQFPFGEYSDDSLDSWSAKIKRWHEGGEPRDAQRCAQRTPKSAKRRDIYCYFDNDQKVRAPFDAQRLARRLGIGWAKQHEGELADVVPAKKARQA